MLHLISVLEHEARVGPVLVLPAKHKSGALPVDERKLSRLVPYGSQWRSGITDRTGKSSLHLIVRMKQQQDE